MSAWSNIAEKAVQFRRALHQAPEIAWEEQKTAEYIRRLLTEAGIPWRTCADTGTVATLNSESKGKSIALRADIDALPMHESGCLDWKSTIPNRMHACGHDGHTATLMAAAWWLKQHEAQLTSPITLLFQPAEEGGHGAKRMIEDGALENVACIFGWHNWPAIPFGQAVCPEGTVMSANATFDIDVTGRGGHASQPDQCRDPVLAGAAIVQSLQQVVSRRLPPQTAAVVSVTRFIADSSPTIIPQQAKLSGSIRIADNRLRDPVFDLIEETASSTAVSYSCTAEMTRYPRYAATVNHKEASAKWRDTLSRHLGPSWQSDVAIPIMASEDFSYYLAEIPGAYALIGSGQQGHDNPPCHNPSYDFNDGLIDPVARLFIDLAGGPKPD